MEPIHAVLPAARVVGPVLSSTRHQEAKTIIRHYAAEAFLLIVLIAAASADATASWDNWNCNLRAYWGAVGGAPQDTGPFLGVKPEATDAYDPSIDARRPPDVPGPYISAFFNRPGWEATRITQDW